LGNLKESIRLELVYIYKDGMWIKLVYHDQQNSVVGEIN
jgi:hypothetical protein